MSRCKRNEIEKAAFCHVTWTIEAYVKLVFKMTTAFVGSASLAPAFSREVE